MFAIFNGKKQLSEKVSTLEFAKELLKQHRKTDKQGKLEVKAQVHAITKDGAKKHTTKGKNSLQWVSIEEYNRRLQSAESNEGLF